MKLSISNIAWDKKYDNEVFQYLKQEGIEGLEIAPTRLFSTNPYSHLQEANKFNRELYTLYHLKISSMQSIWFGKTEKLFNSKEERKILLDYTKEAIDFANAIDCHNIVFGSPKNRVTYNENDYQIAKSFFNELGEYAYTNDTIIAIEPNPTIYGTNFINTTQDAIDFVKEINNPGIMVNFDLGTAIYNQEDINQIDFDYVNHIHISEPYLADIKWKKIHEILFTIIKKHNYDNFISIEMKNGVSIEQIKILIKELKELFK